MLMAQPVSLTSGSQLFPSLLGVQVMSAVITDPGELNVSKCLLLSWGHPYKSSLEVTLMV